MRTEKEIRERIKRLKMAHMIDPTDLSRKGEFCFVKRKCPAQDLWSV